MILAPLGGVQRPPEARVGEEVDLAADLSRRGLERRRVAAEVEEQSRGGSLAQVRGSPFEERVEREAPHERAVHKEEIVTGHGAGPRIPEGPAHSARRPPT